MVLFDFEVERVALLSHVWEAKFSEDVGAVTDGHVEFDGCKMREESRAFNLIF